MADDASSGVNELIRRARVLGLQDDPKLPESIRRIIGSVDDSKRLMSTVEYQSLCDWSGIQPGSIAMLQTSMQRLVEQSRNALLHRDPSLVDPGGALHPEKRAEACWNDCWQFMRVITIAVATDHPHFTDPHGMACLRDLYAALDVPTEGLKIALLELKQQSLQVLQQPGWQRERDSLAKAFDHLSDELNKSAVKSCKANMKI